VEQIDRILSDENIKAAIHAVKSNKGAAGIDKMPAGALETYFSEHKNLMKLRGFLKSNIPTERVRGVANTRQGWYRRAKLPIVNFLITPEILAMPNKKENRPGLIDPLAYYLRNT